MWTRFVSLVSLRWWPRIDLNETGLELRCFFCFNSHPEMFCQYPDFISTTTPHINFSLPCTYFRLVGSYLLQNAFRSYHPIKVNHRRISLDFKCTILFLYQEYKISQSHNLIFWHSDSIFNHIFNFSPEIISGEYAWDFTKFGQSCARAVKVS